MLIQKRSPLLCFDKINHMQFLPHNNFVGACLLVFCDGELSIVNAQHMCIEGKQLHS